MDGLILVDKPPEITSHDVILRVRRALATPRVGHFGTLDPMATGLLLVAVGKVTKLFPFFSAEDKTYAGRIRLGFSTDSYDATGRPTSLPAPRIPAEEEVLPAMARLVGEIEQIPPAYSAKKFAGKPLYRWTRAKKPVVCKPVKVRVYSFTLTAYEPPEVEFECCCSAGTYIRSLAHELGLSLGCGAHLSALRRLASGGFSIDKAHSLSEIERRAAERKTADFLLPPEKLLLQLPGVVLKDEALKDLQKGRPIPASRIIRIDPPALPPGSGIAAREACRIVSAEGRFLGLVRQGPNRSLTPFLLF